MKLFFYVVVGVLCWDALGKLWWLATGEFPARTPSVTAIDLFISLLLLGWAIFVWPR